MLPLSRLGFGLFWYLNIKSQVSKHNGFVRLVIVLAEHRQERQGANPDAFTPMFG